MQQKYNLDKGYVTAQETIATLPVYPINRQPNDDRISSYVSQVNRNFRHHLATSTNQIQSNVARLPRSHANEENYATAREYLSDDDTNDEFNQTIDSDIEVDNVFKDNSGATTELIDLFKTYVENSQQHRSAFSQKEVIAINLSNTLRKTNAPLSQYEEMMKWHLTGSQEV